MKIVQVQPTAKPISLSPRMIEILKKLSQGKTRSMAAVELGLSPHTIATFIESAYARLDVCNAVSAVMKAKELGFID